MNQAGVYKASQLYRKEHPVPARITGATESTAIMDDRMGATEVQVFLRPLVMVRVAGADFIDC